MTGVANAEIREMHLLLILLQHNFRGLNNRRNRVADLEVHLFGASSGYYALNEIISNADHDVSHNAAELEFGDFSFKPVACR